MIRRAGTADLSVMERLHAEAFPKPWSAADLSSFGWATGAFSLIAEPDAGFAMLRVVADEAEILTLAVGVAHRRRGVATALVKASAGAAAERGARRLFLEVSQTNEAARRLYETCGFVEVGRRRNYYAGAADAIAMLLPLVTEAPS